jgi:hypothetical protein
VRIRTSSARPHPPRRPAHRRRRRDHSDARAVAVHHDDLQRSAVEAALATMATSGQSISSIRQAATIFNGCYSWAVTAGKTRSGALPEIQLPDGTYLTARRRKSQAKTNQPAD